MSSSAAKFSYFTEAWRRNRCWHRENPAGMLDAFMAISQGAISRNSWNLLSVASWEYPFPKYNKLQEEKNATRIWNTVFLQCYGEENIGACKSTKTAILDQTNNPFSANFRVVFFFCAFNILLLFQGLFIYFIPDYWEGGAYKICYKSTGAILFQGVTFVI